MQAKIEAGWQLLSRVEHIGNETILVGPCVDFDAFARLPTALRWEDQLFALTGWNSDKGEAYWKQGVSLLASVARLP